MKRKGNGIIFKITGKEDDKTTEEGRAYKEKEPWTGHHLLLLNDSIQLRQRYRWIISTHLTCALPPPLHLSCKFTFPSTISLTRTLYTLLLHLHYSPSISSLAPPCSWYSWTKSCFVTFIFRLSTFKTPWQSSYISTSRLQYTSPWPSQHPLPSVRSSSTLFPASVYLASFTIDSLPFVHPLSICLPFVYIASFTLDSSQPPVHPSLSFSMRFSNISLTSLSSLMTYTFSLVTLHTRLMSVHLLLPLIHYLLSISSPPIYRQFINYFLYPWFTICPPTCTFHLSPSTIFPLPAAASHFFLSKVEQEE